MSHHPLAGQPAPPDMLENIPRLVSDYFTNQPDVEDPEQRVAGSYGVRGYPTTVVIDRAGRIVLSELGAWDWSHPDAVAWLRELLAQ